MIVGVGGEGDEAGRYAVKHLQVGCGAVEGGEEVPELLFLSGDGGGSEEESALGGAAGRHGLEGGGGCHVEIRRCVDGHERGSHCVGLPAYSSVKGEGRGDSWGINGREWKLRFKSDQWP